VKSSWFLRAFEWEGLSGLLGRDEETVFKRRSGGNGYSDSAGWLADRALTRLEQMIRDLQPAFVRARGSRRVQLESWLADSLNNEGAQSADARK
jgi:hypothetical protein